MLTISALISFQVLRRLEFMRWSFNVVLSSRQFRSMPILMLSDNVSPALLSQRLICRSKSSILCCVSPAKLKRIRLASIPAMRVRFPGSYRSHKRCHATKPSPRPAFWVIANASPRHNITNA